MLTHIIDKMGKDFDPERHCLYTGLALHQFPTLGGPGNGEPLQACFMGYWREDGELTRVRDLTPGELDWITANPQSFLAEREGFEAWLRPLQAATLSARESRGFV